MVKLNKVHRFVGELKLITGLHIGGNKDNLQIGGVDSPVIKIRENNKELPYIPGSSLKGKLRSLLELSDPIYAKYNNLKETKNLEELNKLKPTIANHIISKLFGSEISGQGIPGAVIIRDAFLINEDKFKDKKYIYEIKAENSINRVKGTANSPRFIERVNPGLRFNVEIIIKEYEGVNYEEIKHNLIHAFEMLENDYLGGNGTRGYGKVDVSDIINKLEENDEVKNESS